jgi:FKBP-type peptidyl-prolyl cis-trans isomerase
VQTVDLKVGEGPEVQFGDKVMLSYTGSLVNGTVFDSNVPPENTVATKPPFTFVLTQGENGKSIPGLNTGVQGMHVGGERRITIPPDSGYGDKAYGPIPANSTLIFDVKLLGVLNASVQSQNNKTDVKVGTGPEVKPNDWVTAKYTLELFNGYPVGSSNDNGSPIQFQAGTGEMGDAKYVTASAIVDDVVGMKVGGVREVEMTGDLAFDAVKGAPAETGGGLIKGRITLLRISKSPTPSKK